MSRDVCFSRVGRVPMVTIESSVCLDVFAIVIFVGDGSNRDDVLSFSN